MRLARTLRSVAAAAISTAARAGDSADAAAITFRCTNPKSKTTRQVNVDHDRGTADSFPAKNSDTQIDWHGTLHGGGYHLDRASGALTFLNASRAGRLCDPPHMPCRLTLAVNHCVGKGSPRPLGRQSDARRWTISLYAAVGSGCAAIRSSGERGRLVAQILGSIA